MDNKIKSAIIVLSFIAVLFLCKIIFVNDFSLSKPIYVTFYGIENEKCYAAPFCYDPEEKYYDYIGKKESKNELLNGLAYNYVHECDDPDVFEAFENYTDFSMLSFMYAVYDVCDKETVCIPYDTPELFKIVLYYPETNRFEITRIAQKYADKSYFTATYDTENNIFQMKRKFIFTKDIVMILLQIILSSAAVLFTAYTFGYRNKKELTAIAVINILTLSVLNILGFLIKFFIGTETLLESYIGLMFVAFIIHSLIYIKSAIVPENHKDYETPILYAFASNVAGFGISALITIFIFG